LQNRGNTADHLVIAHTGSEGHPSLCGTPVAER